jgi:hypothetical protein
MEVVENQQLDEGMTIDDFLTARKNRERSEKRKNFHLPVEQVFIHQKRNQKEMREEMLLMEKRGTEVL